MTQLLLIRHASHDLLGVALAGWTPGVHLNAAGRREADALAARLADTPHDALCTSPLERARETALAIATRGGPAAEVRDALGEIRFGEWTGRRFAELERDTVFQRFNRDRLATRIPGGESMLEVQARIVRELEALAWRHPGGRVAVVSHGDVIKAAIAHVLGMSLDAIPRFDVSPASISIIAWIPGDPRVLALNDTAHLAAGAAPAPAAVDAAMRGTTP
jgi:probable phosphoglycerate mutase